MPYTPGISFIPGARLGSYEIVGALGAGGMGEVYRARDTKLNRDVAIKVLLPAVANDPDRLARFSREAQVLASLNHPNIAHIHGIEEANGVTALILEFVDGEDLAQRIRRGPIPLAEALPIARQIAEALEAAHDHGIIHRDLKPANIKVRVDGTVKVLDFGLAKAVDPTAGSSESAMNSPTLSNHATEAGSILGTAAYMSPEQAAGKTVDKRSDLWAFGVVLFEMLTARRTFAGETTSHVLASVLKDEPDWNALPPPTPTVIRKLLRRCLEKDRKRRLADASDARLDIDDALAGSPEAPGATATPARGFRRELAGWGVAAVVAIAAATLLSERLTAPASDMTVARFSISPPEGSTLAASMSGGRGGWGSPLVVSPDGRRIVLVVVAADGSQRLWIRALDAAAPQPLAGTEGASGPFWSPDSQSIAFFAAGKLKRIAASGGEAQILCDSSSGGGGTWNRDDVILFSPVAAGEGGLVTVPGSGGTPVAVTALNPARGETNHLWPQFLPDGRHFLFVSGAKEGRGLYVGSLDSKQHTMLLGVDDLGQGYTRIEYAAPGYLLFVRNRALLARAFDATRLEVSGDVIRVADNVLSEGPGSSSFSAGNGVLAFWSGVVPPDSQLTWLRRDGTPGGTVGAPGGYFSLSLAPDERTVAVGRFEPNESTLLMAVWLIDVARSTSTKFTFGTGADHHAWSRDGARLAFASPRGGPPSLHLKSVDSGTPEELLFQGPSSTRPTDWSDAGGMLIYQALGSGTQWDLWRIPTTGTRTPVPLLQTAFNETDGRISPDGRWLAYVSDESGAREVYVTSFPTPRGKWPVSVSGGDVPEWRRDGKELYYVAANRMLTAVPVLNGATFGAGSPRALFEMPRLARTTIGFREHQYAPAADGQRFLMRVQVSGSKTSVAPATVVLNWTGEIPK